MEHKRNSVNTASLWWELIHYINCLKLIDLLVHRKKVIFIKCKNVCGNKMVLPGFELRTSCSATQYISLKVDGLISTRRYRPSQTLYEPIYTIITVSIVHCDKPTYVKIGYRQDPYWVAEIKSHNSYSHTFRFQGFREVKLP